MLGEAGDRQRAAGRAERDDELVVGQLVDAALAGMRGDDAALGVDPGDVAEAELGALELLAQRDDDVARLERAAGRAGQQRRVEHEVDVGDDRDLGRLGGEQLLERRAVGRPA